MAFSLFGKKDEPVKKDDPGAKKPAAGQGGASSVAPRSGVSPPPPKPVGRGGGLSQDSVPPREESVPVEGDDLDFTDLFADSGPAASTPAAAKADASKGPAKSGAAAPGGDLPFDMGDLMGLGTPAATPAPPAAAPAAPAAKAAPPAAAPAPAAPPKAAPPAVPAAAPAKPAAPVAAAPAAAAKPAAPAPSGGPPQIEKTFMPAGRTLSAEKPPAAKPGPAEPARPRASASAGPSSPPSLTPAAAKPAAPPATAAPTAAKPAAPPAAAKPAVPPAAAPAAKPAAPAAPAAAPKPQPAPAVAKAPAPTAAPEAPAEVSEPELTLPQPLQQAAVMYANGQADNAVKALKAAIAAGNLGDFAAQAWLMLFDLYQAQGNKELHEELALEFVVKFERSAPAWRDEPKEAQDAASQRGMGSYFALTGVLSKNSEAEFEQLQKVANKGSLLRFEFGKLKGVDPEGAQMLLEALKGLVKAKRELVLSNHKNLVDLLSSHMEVGNKDNPQVYWMLLLDLYQILGLQTEFDDTALNFAITYELSPPSFEVLAKPAKADIAAAEAPAGDDEAIHLSGELSGSDDEELARLANSAALRPHVVIDMAKVKRVDFVAAGAILNTVTALSGAKKTVEFRATNELVSALFQVVGITRLAKLIRRR